MKNREKFLLLFVKCFYEKGRKTPSENNSAYRISKTINDTFKNHFGKKELFSVKEICKAFEKNGYLLSEFGKNEFTWEKFHANHVTIYIDKFINIKVQNNKDLGNTWKEHKSSYKQETIDKIDNRKLELFKFWDDNKHLLD